MAKDIERLEKRIAADVVELISKRSKIAFEEPFNSFLKVYTRRAFLRNWLRELEQFFKDVQYESEKDSLDEKLK